jgi:DNA-binding PadR family transcriptional regulator
MVGKSQSYKGNRISPLQFVMLLMLREKPMYGYELLKTLREEFEGVWTPQTGSVYPALKRLEDHGLVHSTVKDGTEYYALAPEGEDFVAGPPRVNVGGVRRGQSTHSRACSTKRE